uniref:Uncharacterized protein n=1 Tax=Fibrocapsa japonica TaxID=94617 RepID=A0A7S2URZ5_9STRA
MEASPVVLAGDMALGLEGCGADPVQAEEAGGAGGPQAQTDAARGMETPELQVESVSCLCSPQKRATARSNGTGGGGGGAGWSTRSFRNSFRWKQKSSSSNNRES